MAMAKTFSASPLGVDGFIVEVEAASQASSRQILITGLAGEVVKESRERIRACLNGLGFRVPKGKTVIHLSPASQRKQGSQFDLAIAMSLLVAEEHLSDFALGSLAFLGELSLDGHIRAVPACLSLAETLSKNPSIHFVFVPKGNEQEAALIGSEKVRVVDHLKDIFEFLRSKVPPPAAIFKASESSTRNDFPSLDSVQGQNLAKRALQVALAGGHHFLMMGSPGVGKSLLARCAPHLLPPLEDEERREVAKCRVGKEEFSQTRPFRAPHHSISYAGLLGGGSAIVQPGEVTLAHRGVLFLDELAEFRRDAVEGLRIPLEEGCVSISRVGYAVRLPARFLLIAAMNPCPCGNSGVSGSKRPCICSQEQLSAYRKKVSGPLWDRIDLGVALSHPRKQATPSALSQKAVKDSIASALKIQRKRAGSILHYRNADMPMEHEAFALGRSDRDWVDQLVCREGLSYRGRDRLIRVARTVADLARETAIARVHLLESWSLKCPPPHLIQSLASAMPPSP